MNIFYSCFICASVITWYLCFQSADMIPVQFGNNSKAQLSARTVFGLAHRHGAILRDGWKNILDCILQLYRAKLLPDLLVKVGWGKKGYGLGVEHSGLHPPAIQGQATPGPARQGGLGGGEGQIRGVITHIITMINIPPQCRICSIRSNTENLQRKSENQIMGSAASYQFLCCWWTEGHNSQCITIKSQLRASST